MCQPGPWQFSAESTSSDKGSPKLLKKECIKEFLKRYCPAILMKEQREMNNSRLQGDRANLYELSLSDTSNIFFPQVPFLKEISFGKLKPRPDEKEDHNVGKYNCQRSSSQPAPHIFHIYFFTIDKNFQTVLFSAPLQVYTH